ncbi:hypothetical protein DB347_15025 [Opitutaceae bacterium EW11]|nr:hypothetical protein DB347_15025 [Opitutaceae bacterium EW11]
MMTLRSISHICSEEIIVTFVNSSVTVPLLAQELDFIRDRVRKEYWRHAILISDAAAEQTTDDQAAMQALIYGVALRTVQTARVAFIAHSIYRERLRRLLPIIEDPNTRAHVFPRLYDAIAWLRTAAWRRDRDPSNRLSLNERDPAQNEGKRASEDPLGPADQPEDRWIDLDWSS